MLTQYEAMTVQKIAERKEENGRKLSLRTSILLKESFDTLSKPVPKPKPEGKK